MTSLIDRAKIGFAVLAVALGLSGLAQIVSAPQAEAHSGYCTTHYSPSPGPGAGKRHTTGHFVSGTDYKITVVETLSYSGYWYVSSSFRRDCR
jgi:hypothetical protein